MCFGGYFGGCVLVNHFKPPFAPISIPIVTTNISLIFFFMYLFLKKTGKKWKEFFVFFSLEKRIGVKKIWT